MPGVRPSASETGAIAMAHPTGASYLRIETVDDARLTATSAPPPPTSDRWIDRRRGLVEPITGRSLVATAARVRTWAGARIRVTLRESEAAPARFGSCQCSRGSMVSKSRSLRSPR